MTEADLSCVGSEELLEELLRRQDVAVFISRPKANREFQWRIRTTGAIHEALGLCCLAQYSLGKNAVDDTKIE